MGTFKNPRCDDALSTCDNSDDDGFQTEKAQQCSRNCGCICHLSMNPNEAKDKTKQNHLIKVLGDTREFLEAASICGMRYVACNGVGYFRRSLWAACVLVGFGFMCYQILDRIDHFKSFPTKVSIDLGYEQALPFPTITICNENMWKRSVLMSKKYHFLRPQEAVKLASEMYPPIESVRPDFTNIDFSPISEWSEFYVNHSFTKEDLFIKCDWQGMDCYNQLTRVKTDMGVCFSFNQEGKLLARGTGPMNGLQLVLDAQQDEYVAPADRAYSAGFRILPHSSNEVPRMKALGLKVGPNAQTLIGMTIKKHKFMEYPHGDCVNNRTLKYYPNYSVSGCKTECETDFITKECGCQELHMRRHAYPICNPKQLSYCVRAAYENYINNGEEMRCVCNTSCDDIEYRRIVTSSLLSKFVVRFLAKRERGVYSEQDLRDNRVSVDVYFEDKTVTTIRQQPAYTIYALFCDLGGALGFILGSTLLILVECLDFILVSLYALILRDRSAALWPWSKKESSK